MSKIALSAECREIKDSIKVDKEARTLSDKLRYQCNAMSSN